MFLLYHILAIVDYTQNNEYNGFGQGIKKTEGTEETNYFYDGTSVLYTTDSADAVTAFNIIGAEDNILTTARYDGDAVSFYTYTKDLRESTVNLVGSDGTAKVSYEYSDYGETEIFGDESFYNEVCHGGGIYDKTTGLYYLNARHYDPEDAIFMSQDTYRGDRSRTATLNYYAYCAGNPINYTDPSGHAFWGIIGAAMGAYDGYKYAKKKKLSGWKKAAAIVGGAALGAVNPCKVAKAAKKVYKFAKSARKAYKAGKLKKKAKAVARLVKSKVKRTVKKAAAKAKPKIKKAVCKAKKLVGKNGCFVAGTKILTKDGFKNIEAIKVGDYVWSQDPSTSEKALKSVKKIFVREKDSIIRLAINGEVIETTEEHPFYIEGRGFVNAGQLKAGDEVRLESGEEAYIEWIEEVSLDEPIKVYNFEVEDFHTYYVSEQKVLVHNNCGDEDIAQNVKGDVEASTVKIINKKYANETFTLTGELADKYPNGVKFSENGFPDFSPYSIKNVRIDNLTGKSGDFAKANKAAGLLATPKGYTWHHVEDGVTMRLIPSDLHNAVRHTGGAAMLKKGMLP